MKGSVTGEVGTIVSFWLKGDSLSRGWHRQRDLKYGSDIKDGSLHAEFMLRKLHPQSRPTRHESGVSWAA